MRNLKLKILIAFILCSRTAFSQNIIPVDKAAHFGLAAVSTAALIRCGQIVNPKHTITWQNRLLSSGIVTALSVAKEIEDKRRNGDQELDRGDLAVDAGGIILGNILIIDF